MSRSLKAVEGLQHGKLTVIRALDEKDKHGNRYLWCACMCGREVRVRLDNLPRTLSCGCAHGDRGLVMKTHGMTGTPEYQDYWSAKNRCQRPDTTGYKNYGGRGIRFLFETFEEFYAALGPIPGAGFTLERKDSNGPYSPANCKWLPRSLQNRNRRPRRTKAQIALEERAALERIPTEQVLFEP